MSHDGVEPDKEAQAALDAVYDEPPPFRNYLFNVMTTVEVTAQSEEEALDILNDDGGSCIDRDVMLVEVE